MNVYDYWRATLNQEEEAMRPFFHQNAQIRWHNSNEQFDLEEYIQANCEYPNDWDGEVQRVETIGDLIVTVTHVFTKDNTLSFHATSFIQMLAGKIISIDEYWGDDGSAPQWRLDKKIGKPIK